MASTNPPEGSDDEGVVEIPRRQQISSTRVIGPPSSSSSRMRSTINRVWPAPFLEDLALRVAADAARERGRLTAAPAFVTLFQVCSTWHAVSHSELLWKNLTCQVWSHCNELTHLPTWKAEYTRCHRIAWNFRTANSVYMPIAFHDAAQQLIVRRIVLSGSHLLVGFIDGSVRLFDIHSSLCLATYGPYMERDLLGPFSRSICGLIFDSHSSSLVFASQDGDIRVASTLDHNGLAQRVRVGNVVEDGTLVDFTGCTRWWVGLFAGVPGRSLQVWHGSTAELIYLGGTVTDADSVLGWRMLTEMSPPVGRVRVPGRDAPVLIACTSSSIQVVDMENDVGTALVEHALHRGSKVEAMDACDGKLIVVDLRGLAKVFLVPSMDEVCRFSVDAARGLAAISACLGTGEYVVVYCAGRVRVWDAYSGEVLYQMDQRVSRSTGASGGIVAASDRYVVVWVGETSGLLHVWDFGVL